MRAVMEPMSMWEILDRSVRLYRRHVWKLFAASALVGLAGYAINRLALFGIQMCAANVPLQDAPVGQVLLLALLGAGVSVIALVVGYVEIGVLAVLVADAYFRDRVSLRDGLKRVPFGPPWLLRVCFRPGPQVWGSACCWFPGCS